ncbi:MAG: hypothetical protein Q8P67_04960, partial [archaeon]|nr:hypothetical protein [archaeon]
MSRGLFDRWLLPSLLRKFGSCTRDDLLSLTRRDPGGPCCCSRTMADAAPGRDRLTRSPPLPRDPASAQPNASGVVGAAALIGFFKRKQVEASEASPPSSSSSSSSTSSTSSSPSSPSFSEDE